MCPKFMTQAKKKQLGNDRYVSANEMCVRLLMFT